MKGFLKESLNKCVKDFQEEHFEKFRKNVPDQFSKKSMEVFRKDSQKKLYSLIDFFNVRMHEKNFIGLQNYLEESLDYF